MQEDFKFGGKKKLPGPHMKGKFHAANIQDTVPLIFLQLLPIIKSWLVVSIQPAHLIWFLAQSSGSSSLIFNILTSQSFSLIDSHLSCFWSSSRDSIKPLRHFLYCFKQPFVRTTISPIDHLTEICTQFCIIESFTHSMKQMSAFTRAFKSVQKATNKISTFFLPCKSDIEEVLLSRTLLEFPSSSVCWKGWRCRLLPKSNAAHSRSGCLRCPHVQGLQKLLCQPIAPAAPAVPSQKINMLEKRSTLFYPSPPGWEKSLPQIVWLSIQAISFHRNLWHFNFFAAWPINCWNPCWGNCSWVCRLVQSKLYFPQFFLGDLNPLK